jgi:hypothetical protein
MHKCVFFFLINSGSSQQINIATGPKREVPGVPDAFSASSSHGALPPLPSSMSDVYRGRDLKKQLGGSRFPVNLKLHNTDSQYTVNLKNTRFWKTAVTSLHRKKIYTKFFVDIRGSSNSIFIRLTGTEIEEGRGNARTRQHRQTDPSCDYLITPRASDMLTLGEQGERVCVLA